MSRQVPINDALPTSRSRDLPDAVRSSWLRCVTDHGLDPHRMREPDVLTVPEMQDVTAPIEELIALASPEMRRLFDRLAGDGYLVSLASASGVNLVYRCEHDLVGTMERFGIVPGAIWLERSQGTNGIGTCIQAGQPVSIITTEHFDDKLKTFSCTDAPIFGAGRKLECVINATTDRPTDHRIQRLVRDIVVRSSRRIENTYFARRHPEARILRIASEIDFVDVASETRIAIDGNDRVLDATSTVGDILTVGLDDIVGRSFYEIFAADRQLENYATPKALGPGLSWQPRVYALFEGAPSRRSVALKAGVVERQYHQRQPLRYDRVFLEHPVLAARIPVASRLVRACAPVLLTGEPGVGKEKIARMLYEDSDHADFAVVRSRSGGEKALSDLLSDHGFEGVLYIEDIEHLPSQSQYQLFWRLFGDRSDARASAADSSRRLAVIASSTAPGATSDRTPSLDRCLLDAFAGVAVEVPPLRTYPDIEGVIETVFELESRRKTRTGLALSAEVREILGTHLWSGNLAELERVARFACALCDSSTVELQHLPRLPGTATQSHHASAGGGENTAILEAALQHNGWNVSRTARYLGISRATRYRKLNDAGIKRP